MKFWIDAHSHLAMKQLLYKSSEILLEASRHSIAFFLQGGVDPDDWQKQQKLYERHPQQIGLCFGLHPYFVCESSDSECEEALNLLSQNLKTRPVLALGEMGLDFRPKILERSGESVAETQERQMEVFSLQLELAQVTGHPVVIHCVQAFEESLKILDMYASSSQKGFVHAFNGSWAKGQEYIQRGLLLSIGGALLRPGNERLTEVIRHIPLESLLLETDSPDQGPPNTAFAEENHPVSLLLVAEKIAEIRKISIDELRSVTSENFLRLFPQLNRTVLENGTGVHYKSQHE